VAKPYLLAELNPELESSSGGTITVYWKATCSIGGSDACLSSIENNFNTEKGGQRLSKFHREIMKLLCHSIQTQCTKNTGY